jgi:hypothetical protein
MPSTPRPGAGLPTIPYLSHQEQVLLALQPKQPRTLYASIPALRHPVYTDTQDASEQLLIIADKLQQLVSTSAPAAAAADLALMHWQLKIAYCISSMIPLLPILLHTAAYVLQNQESMQHLGNCSQ